MRGDAGLGALEDVAVSGEDGDRRLLTLDHLLFQNPSPGWKWTLWLLGAGLSVSPVVSTWIERGQVTEEAVWTSVVVAAVLFAAYEGLALLFNYAPSWVEPVLVVTILGVLVGILLPVRHSSDCTPKNSGINNLKQIGLALRIYEDREGYFPKCDGDAFLAAVYASGDMPDLRCFSPKGVRQRPVEQVKGMHSGCIPGMAAYRNATFPMKDAANPSAFAIACDTLPDGRGPYGGGHIRCVLYQDGSAKPMTDLTIGSTNGDPGGPKDLSMLQMD